MKEKKQKNTSLFLEAATMKYGEVADIYMAEILNEILIACNVKDWHLNNSTMHNSMQYDE